MFKRKYEKLNNHIVPDQNLINKVKNFSDNKKSKQNML